MAIAIIDYGLGNLGSISNIIRKCGGKCYIASGKEDVEGAEKIILPGVGAFDKGMSRINEMGIANVLRQKALRDKVPVLGICLGMQLLTQNSEEGKLEGLGLVDASVHKFSFVNIDGTKKKVPHMGWNYVNNISNCDILNVITDEIEVERFYFVHSYFVKCNNKNNIAGLTKYGQEFVSVFQKENIYGVQFHPEKSHKYGMRLFKKFINL